MKSGRMAGSWMMMGFLNNDLTSDPDFRHIASGSCVGSRGVLGLSGVYPHSPRTCQIPLPARIRTRRSPINRHFGRIVSSRFHDPRKGDGTPRFQRGSMTTAHSLRRHTDQHHRKTEPPEPSGKESRGKPAAHQRNCKLRGPYPPESPRPHPDRKSAIHFSPTAPPFPRRYG